jgi:hypothetical protein
MDKKVQNIEKSLIFFLSFFLFIVFILIHLHSIKNKHLINDLPF